MKFDFELTVEDYKKASFKILKRNFLFAFIFFLVFSVFVSFLNYLEDRYKLANYLASYFSLLFIVLVMWIIPVYRNYKKSQKFVNSNSGLFGLKSFELTKEGLIHFNENKPSTYKWKEIKRIYLIKSYGFIVLRNKTSILFKNNNLEFAQKLKEYRKKYSH